MGSTQEGGHVDFRELKKRARKQANENRAKLTEEEKQRYSDQICDKLLMLPAAKTAEYIAVYQWMRNEVRLDKAIAAWRERGAHVLFPCSTGNRTMYFHEVDPTGELPDYMKEPGKLFDDPDADKAIPAKQFDMVVIPGVAFDNQRNRCGYGGGYYDTLLEELEGTDCFLVAVGFDEQFVEQVPVGRFDRKMPMIITQTRILCE